MPPTVVDMADLPAFRRSLKIATASVYGCSMGKVVPLVNSGTFPFDGLFHGTRNIDPLSPGIKPFHMKIHPFIKDKGLQHSAGQKRIYVGQLQYLTAHNVRLFCYVVDEDDRKWTIRVVVVSASATAPVIDLGPGGTSDQATATGTLLKARYPAPGTPDPSPWGGSLVFGHGVGDVYSAADASLFTALAVVDINRSKIQLSLRTLTPSAMAFLLLWSTDIQFAPTATQLRDLFGVLSCMSAGHVIIERGIFSKMAHIALVHGNARSDVLVCIAQILTTVLKQVGVMLRRSLVHTGALDLLLPLVDRPVMFKLFSVLLDVADTAAKDRAAGHAARSLTLPTITYAKVAGAAAVYRVATGRNLIQDPLAPAAAVRMVWLLTEDMDADVPANLQDAYWTNVMSQVKSFHAMTPITPRIFSPLAIFGFRQASSGNSKLLAAVVDMVAVHGRPCDIDVMISDDLIAEASLAVVGAGGNIDPFAAVSVVVSRCPAAVVQAYSKKLTPDAVRAIVASTSAPAMAIVAAVASVVGLSAPWVVAANDGDNDGDEIDRMAAAPASKRRRCNSA